METFKRHFQKYKRFYFSLLSLLIIYKLVFNRFTGQFILSKSLRGFIRGTASFTVTKFSLFYGISFKNVLLKTEFEERPVLSVRELELSYNLPWIFLGRVKLSKIAVIGLRMDLRQEGGGMESGETIPVFAVAQGRNVIRSFGGNFYVRSDQRVSEFRAQGYFCTRRFRVRSFFLQGGIGRIQSCL